MKKYIKTIALSLLAAGGAAALVSCTEDKVYEVNINAVPQAADYADCVKITVDQETNYANFEFTGKGVYPVWIIDGKSYSTDFAFSRYYRKAGDYSVEVKIGNANGVSTGTIAKSFTVDKTKMNGFAGFDYESPYNLVKAEGTDIHLNSFWYAPGWAQIADPAYTYDGDAWTVTLPEATTDQWQAQMHIGSNICLEEGKSYDGSFIFTSTMDIKNVTLKIHPDGDDDDAHSFFCNQKINLTAGEPVTYWFSNLPAVVPMNNLVFTLDFGGNPAGIEVTIENFVLKDHANDDGTVLPELPATPEPDWAAPDSPENLWSGANITPSFYYAPGWAQIADPALTFDGKDFTVEFPAATFEQWQAQVKLVTDLPAIDTETAYDFKITLSSNTAHPGVTIKLVETDIDDTQEGKRDGNFFFAERIPLDQDSPKTFWVAGVKAPQAMHEVQLVLDFGGNAENTTVSVSGITFQVHHD